MSTDDRTPDWLAAAIREAKRRPVRDDTSELGGGPGPDPLAYHGTTPPMRPNLPTRPRRVNGRGSRMLRRFFAGR